MFWSYPERSGGKLPEAEKGVRGKGRQPLSPHQHTEAPAKAQRNFTDADSRIMLDGATKGFVQGYNAQAAVDSAAQIIVAAEITEQGNDKKQLVPMMQAVEKNLGQKPEHATTDAGYFSEQAVTDPAVSGVDLLVAVSREKHGQSEQADNKIISIRRSDASKPGWTILISFANENFGDSKTGWDLPHRWWSRNVGIKRSSDLQMLLLAIRGQALTGEGCKSAGGDPALRSG